MPGLPLPLHHRDLGGAGRPPLVILHGMLGSSRNWQTAGRDLAARRHVFALDLRNHGLSPHGDSMGYDDMAGDVVAWLDSRKLDSAALLGHSMGGKVAMTLACRHPSRVERLVVVDVAPRDYVWLGRRAEFAAMIDLDIRKIRTRAEAEAHFEPRVADWAMRKFLASNLERMPEGGWRWQINLPSITASLSTLEKNPLGPGDRFSGPTLVVAGGRSSCVTPPDWALITGHFPAARLEMIAESGHNPHMETREAFVKAVLAFI